MRLPRRTPWADLGELDQVCRLIYSDESNPESKRKAVRKVIKNAHRYPRLIVLIASLPAVQLAAWKYITPIPPALEITLSLLTVTLQDSSYDSELPPPSSSSSFLGTNTNTNNNLALRQAYALSVVRLVNSLVDPLQQGVFARPIAAIAAQIGLPAWFVELRHQATHEDLPALGVLREAAREALAWLLQNYFLSTLSPDPSSSSSSASTIRLSPVEPLLQRYKLLVKATSKDATLVKRRTPEFEKVFRDVERWLGEAKVASWGAAMTNLNSGTDDGDEEEGEWKESWALDRLCEALLGRGGLVPVSKKKRPQPSSKVPLPPNHSMWSPLLTRLASTHPRLPSQLAANLIRVFELPPDSASSSVSYKWSVAGWIAWTTTEWGSEECSVPVTVRALLAVVPGTSTEDDRTILKILITTLAASDPGLKKKVKVLLAACDQAHEATSNADVEMNGSDEQLVIEMSDRLKRIQGAVVPGQDEDVGENTTKDMDDDEAPQAEPAGSKEIARGWRLLTLEEWTPRPVGVF
ncbi:rRNA-processing protein las1 [Tulasnella sp. 427]|nr:rRNA-processing protein las1 [Tulasnella sp. 427]